MKNKCRAFKVHGCNYHFVFPEDLNSRDRDNFLQHFGEIKILFFMREQEIAFNAAKQLMTDFARKVFVDMPESVIRELDFSCMLEILEAFGSYLMGVPSPEEMRSFLN